MQLFTRPGRANRTHRTHFLLCAILVGATCSVAHAGEAPIQLCVTPWIGDITAAVAADQGLWKAAGVEVEVVRYQDDDDFRTAIKGGAVDVGFDMCAAMVNSIREGADISIYAETDWSNGGDKIILRKGVTAKDMAGGNIVTYDDGPSVGIFIDAWLTREGVDPSKVERVMLADEQLLPLFVAGKFLALAHYEPLTGKAVNEAGGTIAATTADFPGIMPEGIFGKRGMDAKRMQAVFTGLLGAVAFIKDPAHAAAVTASANKHLFTDDPQTPEAIVAQIATVCFHSLGQIAERNAAGGGLADFIVKADAWAAEHGKAKTELKDRIDTTAVLAAAKALGGN